MASRHRWLVGIGAATIAAAAHASETLIYIFDARGRLIEVRRSGTVNDGITACYALDRADNRSNVTVATASCSPPPPVNQPPNTVADNAAVAVCGTISVNVVANDSDPDGNTPLDMVDILSTSAGSATVVSATNVSCTAPNSTGQATVLYRVADSLGATAIGELTVTVLPGSCQ